MEDPTLLVPTAGAAGMDWVWQSQKTLEPMLPAWPSGVPPSAAQLHRHESQDDRNKMVPLADERRRQARAEELATTESTRSKESGDEESDGSELLASCWPIPDEV